MRQPSYLLATVEGKVQHAEQAAEGMHAKEDEEEGEDSSTVYMGGASAGAPLTCTLGATRQQSRGSRGVEEKRHGRGIVVVRL